MDQISPSILATLERLDSAGFTLLPMAEVSTHYVVGRDDLVALVERRRDGEFGTSGNPGKLTSNGLALFIRRGEQAYFVSKGQQQPASAEEVVRASRFSVDLKAALTRSE